MNSDILLLSMIHQLIIVYSNVWYKSKRLAANNGWYLAMAGTISAINT